jgi:hypothetical protein
VEGRAGLGILRIRSQERETRGEHTLEKGICVTFTQILLGALEGQQAGALH